MLVSPVIFYAYDIHAQSLRGLESRREKATVGSYFKTFQLHRGEEVPAISRSTVLIVQDIQSRRMCLHPLQLSLTFTSSRLFLASPLNPPPPCNYFHSKWLRALVLISLVLLQLTGINNSVACFLEKINIKIYTVVLQ